MTKSASQHTFKITRAAELDKVKLQLDAFLAAVKDDVGTSAAVPILPIGNQNVGGADVEKKSSWSGIVNGVKASMQGHADCSILVAPNQTYGKTLDHFIYEVIKQRSQSGKVYPGLEIFAQGARLQSVMEAPGVAAAGWTAHNVFKGATERDRNINHSKLSAHLKSLLDKIYSSAHSWPFEHPVSKDDSPDYFQIVSDPMDLRTISDRLKSGDYYRRASQMQADLLKIVTACKLYNAKGSEFFDAAESLETQIHELFADAELPAATATN